MAPVARPTPAAVVPPGVGVQWAPRLEITRRRAALRPWRVGPSPSTLLFRHLGETRTVIAGALLIPGFLALLAAAPADARTSTAAPASTGVPPAGLETAPRGRTLTSTASPTGYRRPPVVGSSPGRDLARVALAPGRALGWTLALPARGTAWLIDVLSLPKTLEAIFFDPTLTYGAYPVLGVETPFGVRVGVHAVHRSLFGAGERLQVIAEFGGRLNQAYAVDLSTGDRLAPVQLALRAGYEAVPRLVFDGVAPERGPRAAVSRRTVSAHLRASLHLFEDADLATELAWWNDAYGPPGSRVGDPFAAELYTLDPFTLSAEDLDTLEAAAEIRYDGRRPGSRFVPPARPSEGTRIALRVGYNHVAEAEGPAYLRFVFDVEQRLPLFDHRRALALRARWAGVGGAQGEIPVFDLPALGGPSLLRGYARGALRGRQAMLVSAEYLFPVVALAGGFVFVEAGAAVEEPDQLGTEVPVEGDLGGGLEVFLWERVLGRAQLAVSRRGDLQLSFGVGTELVLDGRDR